MLRAAVTDEAGFAVLHHARGVYMDSTQLLIADGGRLELPL